MTSEGAAIEAEATREPESTALLGFYDRVRDRILSYLKARGGCLGVRTGEALLLVPDVLLLLLRLFLDRDTPQSSRALIGGALAYFLLPADLAPEIIIGPVGYLDDLVIACTVLGHVLGPELEQTARRYWSGAGRSLEVLGEVSRSGSQLLGINLSKRVDSVIQRRLLRRHPDGASGS